MYVFEIYENNYVMLVLILKRIQFPINMNIQKIFCITRTSDLMTTSQGLILKIFINKFFYKTGYNKKKN